MATDLPVSSFLKVMWVPQARHDAAPFCLWSGRTAISLSTFVVLGILSIFIFGWLWDWNRFVGVAGGWLGTNPIISVI
jgi:hypothetical protein